MNADAPPTYHPVHIAGLSDAGIVIKAEDYGAADAPLDHIQSPLLNRNVCVGHSGTIPGPKTAPSRRG